MKKLIVSLVTVLFLGTVSGFAFAAGPSPAKTPAVKAMKSKKKSMKKGKKKMKAKATPGAK